MPKKPHPLGFVFSNGCVSGPLKHGLTIKGVVHKEFTLREASVDDMLDAEMEVDVTKPLNFNAQMMIRQLVKVGSFEGPFTMNMVRQLKPADWRVLRQAQTEVDSLGEGESASEAES
jgi:phage FluMu protein gp41